MARFTLPTKSESSSTATQSEDATFWHQLHLAARQQDVNAAIRDLYAEIDQAIAARGPTCWISGRCCNFDAFGHRLFVTGLEIAWVLGQHQSTDKQSASPQRAANNFQIEAEGPCPFQVNGLCNIHLIRPMGCRIFFCQQGTDQWQGELYERFLTQLHVVHDRYGVPYRYMEWRLGLTEAVQHHQNRL